MKGWQTHSGEAVELPLDNIDTDQLIPARFMSQPRQAGYGQFLLFDSRRDEHGELDSEYPLNQCHAASILVTGRNFGCGSSREAAVYALIDAGFKVVLAPSFGDIFAANAINNGLLPAELSNKALAQLLQSLNTSTRKLTIDLNSLTVSTAEFTQSFHLDQTWRLKLINGWDDIDLTQRYKADITRFKTHYLQHNSWTIPNN